MLEKITQTIIRIIETPKFEDITLKINRIKRIRKQKSD